ncbi:MAG: hypothetical protein J6B49_07885 [Phascolarctobacterium sp.]|nr:hypothetical protein [Phascolarctobacterium sp.]
MIKKVIAVIILIAVLSAFLVIFGGIAILDISIKLMWLSFSAIIAFACKSLGWNISQEIVNKLLAKQNFLPGTLTIDDNPSIKTDKIILYNLCWKDANGEERLNVHEVEVRANIYQVILSLIRKEPLEKFLAIVQEIILKQPLFNMEYTLENKQLLTQYVERLTEVPNLSQEKTAPQPQSSLPEVDALPNLKLYLERGIVDLKINGQRLRLENINGVWRNDPVIDYYLTCQLEDENISLQNQNTINRYLLRASKISLKRLWNILSPIFKIERINLLDGEVTDFKMLVERKNNAWSILSLNWNFNDIMLASHGIIIEEIDGRFSSTDLDTFNIKKLELKLYNHTLRVDGTITTPQKDGSYNYKLKLRSDKIFLKNNVDINIFDGFNLYGTAKRIDGSTVIDVNMDGTLRLDIPGNTSVTAQNFVGKLELDEGIAVIKHAGILVNGSKVALDDCVVNLNNGDYTLHLSGNQLDIALLTDQPVKGETFFYTTIKGSAEKRSCEVNGIYRIENIKYRNLPLSSIHGRIVTNEEGVRLDENFWNIFNRNIPIHCTFEKNAIKIDWGLEIESLKDVFKESVQDAGDAVSGMLNRIKNKFK